MPSGLGSISGGLLMRKLPGRKADACPVRFRQCQVEAVVDQWYDPENIFYKVEPMTAISIFFHNKHRRPSEHGS
jgi:hypothetical protein